MHTLTCLISVQASAGVEFDDEAFSVCLDMTIKTVPGGQVPFQLTM